MIDKTQNFFKDAIDKTGDGFKGAAEKTGAVLKNAKERTGEAYEEVITTTKNALHKASEKTKQTAGKISEKTKETAGKISEKTGETARNLKNNMHELGEATKEKLINARNKFKRFIGTKKDAEDHGLEIDNEYIVNGYRVNHGSFPRAFKSICSCHNETTNVWSHLGGAVFFLMMLFGLFVFVVPD